MPEMFEMVKEIEYGCCHCGCGNKTNLRKSTHRPRGHIEGEPSKFISGHNPRAKRENSKCWKGDRIGYDGLHSWIHREFSKPKKCENCGTTKSYRFEWANISGKYKRDIKDFKRLCVKCHRNFDAHLFVRGENKINAKFTNKEVLEIRKLYKPRHPVYNTYKL